MYKQVIQSILNVELCRITHDFYIKFIINIILEEIFQAKISLIFYKNSNFLYSCFIKCKKKIALVRLYLGGCSA